MTGDQGGKDRLSSSQFPQLVFHVFDISSLGKWRTKPGQTGAHATPSLIVGRKRYSIAKAGGDVPLQLSFNKQHRQFDERHDMKVMWLA